MATTMDPFGFAANATRVYSPVTLSSEWSRIDRLLFTVAFSVIGIIANGFFVASFFVEKSLARRELVYMACSGFSDMIVTSTIMPTSAFVLLSGEGDSDNVCFALQAIAEGATYSYNIFSMLAALESLYKFCESTKNNVKVLLSLQTIFVYLVCAMAGFCGVYLHLDYDYCNRQYAGSSYFKVFTFVLLSLVPCCVTVYSLARANVLIRYKARTQIHYKRSQLHEHESTTNKLNIAAYVLFVTLWAPYVVVVHIYPHTSDSKYYHSAWIGVCRTVVTSLLYGFLDKEFRRAFAHLFNYLCCKNSLSVSYASRHRASRLAVEYNSARLEGSPSVRIHLMQHAVTNNSPQRAGSSTRDVQEL